jgi:class I fructose-bisphosphate aldolase
MTATFAELQDYLGKDAESLLTHRAKVSQDLLTLPGPDFINRVFLQTDRNAQTLRSLGELYKHGRLANTGYMSILPVDQGIEHAAGASFAKNPLYFDAVKIVELAYEGGCNAVASTFGVLGMAARKWAHRIPFIVKVNHNELLTYPNKADQVLFGQVSEAWNMGAVAIGATIYFGAPESSRQIQEVSLAFAKAHELGMATILWCYLRNNSFKRDKDKRIYTDLSTDHPIDLTRYQVLNCYAGRAGLINSGGASGGESDFAEAVRTAVINKRAGGMGLISGRKAFQRPMAEGVKLLYLVQDVYLAKEVTIA